MHPLLARQLRRLAIDPVQGAAGSTLGALLEAVDRAYQQADVDRRMLEHSLELASEELLERNRALERALEDARLSEHSYRQLVESSASGIVAFDAHGRIVTANRAAAAMLRCGPEHLVGRTVLEFLARDEVERVRRRFEGMASGGYVAEAREIGVRRLDGTHAVVRLSTTLVRDREQAEPLILAEFQDISEAVELERQQQKLHDIENERQRLEAVAQSASAGLLVTDPLLQVALVNPTFGALFGIEPSVLVGTSLEGSAAALDAALGEADTIASLIAGAGPDRVEVHSPRTSRFIDLATFEVTGFLGDRLGVGILAIDVTAARHAERQMAEFVSIASHELRTPLTGVVGFAHLLAEALEGTAQAAWAQHIIAESERLSATVSDLLNAARLEGGLRFVTEPVDLGRLLAQAVGAARGGDGRPIELEAADHLWVTADGARLREVFDNLVSNALKYSPPGAPVTIVAARHEGGIEVRVRDRGYGIDEEDLPLVFERYFRAARTSDEVRGTGLGLHIVREFLRQMGGRVSASSSPGEGSEFTVWLPALEVDTAAA